MSDQTWPSNTTCESPALSAALPAVVMLNGLPGSGFSGVLVSHFARRREVHTRGGRTEAIGHLSHADLVSFLCKAKGSLRQNSDAPPTPITPSHPASAGSSASDTFTSLIFVKENVCEDLPDGRGREVFDEEDSSLTR